MTSPGYELEQQRLQSIGQTPPVSMQPMAQPQPMKQDDLQTTYGPEFQAQFTRL